MDITVPLPHAIRSIRVGHRVVVRHRLADGSATDVIGFCERIEPELIIVAPRPGESVEVAVADVIIAKPVPTVPRGQDPLRTTPAELEQAAADAWADHRERLGEWWLRAAGGFTGRANSVLAVGSPGMPLAAAADRAVAFAAAHGIAPLAQVVVDSDEEAALRELGWGPAYVSTAVLVQRLSDLVGEKPPDDRVSMQPVDGPDAVGDDWLAGYRRYRAAPVDDALLRRVLAGRDGAVGLASVTVDARLGALGRVHHRAGWAGVSGLWVDPEHRRQGWATAVLVELGRWAARRHARNLYLQVAEENTDAVAAYTALGFVRHHGYRYLAPA